MLIAGSILIFIASGCTSVKRFKSASYKGEDDSLVDMALFGARLDPPGQEAAGKNLWDLSASAQTQLIQILDERYPDNEQFTGALNREYMLKGSGPVMDYTTSNLRMVFTISKTSDFSSINEAAGRFSPANRIEYLKFTLEVSPESNLHFTGWNRYTTEYGEIEIADVSFSRSLELEAEYSDETAGGKAQGSFSRSEDQAVRSRYLKLNGSISGRKLEIEEEGTREIDLTGNVIADVSLEFDGFPERITIPLYTGGPEGDRAKVSALKFMDVMVPRMEDAPEAIMATLEAEYVYRHVESGWKTFQEWDDRVAYYSGTITRQIPLFERDEYVPALFCIGTDLDGKRALKTRSGTGQEYPLRFGSHAEASRFLDWLIRESDENSEAANSPVVFGEHGLLFGDRPITWTIISSGKPLKVMPVY